MKNIGFSLFAILLISCSPSLFKNKWTKEIAPENYKVRFETSKGNFDVRVTRNLSPKAADRFYQLVKYKYFDGELFYRVNPGYVAQFGASDSIKRNPWDNIGVPDEKTIQGNDRGNLSFARGGKETRTTDLFINLANNNHLDTMYYNDVTGFPAFGKVTKGMPTVDSLFSGYSDTIMSDFDLLTSNRSSFLKKYPKLDSIHTAYLLAE